MAGLNPDDCLVIVKPRKGKELINDDDIIAKIREIGT
jgi:hypothetical protein